MTGFSSVGRAFDCSSFLYLSLLRYKRYNQMYFHKSKCIWLRLSKVYLWLSKCRWFESGKPEKYFNKYFLLKY